MYYEQKHTRRWCWNRGINCRQVEARLVQRQAEFTPLAPFPENDLFKSKVFEIFRTLFSCGFSILFNGQ